MLGDELYHTGLMAEAGGIAERDVPFGAVEASRRLTDAAMQATLTETLRTMRADGFRGERRDQIARVEHAGHRIAIAEYVFDDGSRALFVEAVEEHDGVSAAAVFPLTEAVHLLVNVRDDEFWRIAAAREAP